MVGRAPYILAPILSSSSFLRFLSIFGWFWAGQPHIFVHTGSEKGERKEKIERKEKTEFGVLAIVSLNEVLLCFDLF